MARYELSDNDVGTLRALIDVAVKSGGLQVAEVAVAMSKKLIPIKEEKDGSA